MNSAETKREKEFFPQGWCFNSLNQGQLQRVLFDEFEIKNVMLKKWRKEIHRKKKSHNSNIFLKRMLQMNEAFERAEKNQF